MINSRDPILDEDKVAILVLLKLVPTDGQRNRSDRLKLEISAVSDGSERTEILRASLSVLLVLSPTSKKPRPKLPDLLPLSTPSPSYLEEETSPKLLLPLHLNDQNFNSNLEQNLSMAKKAKEKTTRRTRLLARVRRKRTMARSILTLPR